MPGPHSRGRGRGQGRGRGRGQGNDRGSPAAAESEDAAASANANAPTDDAANDNAATASGASNNFTCVCGASQTAVSSWEAPPLCTCGGLPGGTAPSSTNEVSNPQPKRRRLYRRLRSKQRPPPPAHMEYIAIRSIDVYAGGFWAEICCDFLSGGCGNLLVDWSIAMSINQRFVYQVMIIDNENHDMETDPYLYGTVVEVLNGLGPRSLWLAMLMRDDESASEDPQDQDVEGPDSSDETRVPEDDECPDIGGDESESSSDR